MMKDDKSPFNFMLNVGLDVLTIVQPELTPVSLGLQSLVGQLNKYSDEQGKKMQFLEEGLENLQAEFALLKENK